MSDVRQREVNCGEKVKVTKVHGSGIKGRSW
jgi:hypothetical protein